MALLGFIFLSLSLPEHVTLWSRIIPVHVRERERYEERRRRKKPTKNHFTRDRDMNPRTLSPEPSVLSIWPRRPTQAFIFDSMFFSKATSGHYFDECLHESQVIHDSPLDYWAFIGTRMSLYFNCQDHPSISMLVYFKRPNQIGQYSNGLPDRKNRITNQINLGTVFNLSYLRFLTIKK